MNSIFVLFIGIFTFSVSLWFSLSGFCVPGICPFHLSYSICSCITCIIHITVLYPFLHFVQLVVMSPLSDFSYIFSVFIAVNFLLSTAFAVSHRMKSFQTLTNFSGFGLPANLILASFSVSAVHMDFLTL